LLVMLAACGQSAEPPPPPPPPAPPRAPAPVAIPPKVGEAMELLALACPRAVGAAPAEVEAALRRGHGVKGCFTATAKAVVELGPEGVRSIEAPTPALETCLGHALRRVRIPDGLVGATCTLEYELTR
jgi:hypothetical protein